MRVGKAKRRLLRWQRYVSKTGSRPANPRLGGTHAGMVLAYSDTMYAHTWVPKGVREPWLPLWGSGWSSGT